MDELKRRVLLGAMELGLSRLEFEILRVLMKASTPVRAVDLALAIWGRFAEHNRDVLYARVKSLRHRLEPHGVAIRWERGKGYSVEVRGAASVKCAADKS